MKRSLLILSIASFAIISSTHAQIRKGATLIGGNIGGATTNVDNPVDEDGKMRSLSVGLRLGKAVRENLIVGGIVSYAGNKWEKINAPYDTKVRSYSVGVFARKYQPIGSSGFYIFGTGSLTGNFGTTDYTYDPPSQNIEMKSTGIDLNIDPGISYAVNKWLQVETGLSNLLNLSYQTNTSKDIAGTRKSKSFSGNVNISGQSQLYLGLTILLN